MRSKPAELLPPPVQVTDEEIERALALMETMTVDDLDEYTEAIAQIIEAKREDKPLPQAPGAEESAQVLDLMAALNASVEKARETRGEHGTHAEVHELPNPKRKTAAKKQPANKAAAKKTTAKKASSRKPRSA